MPDPPPGYSIFEDDADPVTAVDQSFWKTPEIPRYPTLARLGRFEILGRIARGGMAEIYLARESADDGTARHVVVKRVLPEMQDNAELLGMFLDEGATVTRLYHPNVCHVYECGEIDGVAFMALEWVFGTSLQAIIERSAERVPLPWPLAAHVVGEVAGALQYVHQAQGSSGQPLNIVHRDVSPHNIMLSWEGAVKLLDFGIAKTGGKDDTGTRGKYAYMSPEQARSKPVDSRADIFALGICLFEALTGKPLYERGTLLDTLSAIVREPPPSLATLRPELPPVLDRIVAKTLAKDPAQRFQSAGELQAALQQALRASAQTVSGQRIGLHLALLFDPKERTALPPNASEITGSFQALSFTAPPPQEITYERFVADTAEMPSEAPPTVELDAPPKSRVGLWIASIAVGLLIGAAGGVAAWFFVWK